MQGLGHNQLLAFQNTSGRNTSGREVKTELKVSFLHRKTSSEIAMAFFRHSKLLADTVTTTREPTNVKQPTKTSLLHVLLGNLQRAPGRGPIEHSDVGVAGRHRQPAPPSSGRPGHTCLHLTLGPSDDRARHNPPVQLSHRFCHEPRAGTPLLSTRPTSPLPTTEDAPHPPALFL